MPRGMSRKEPAINQRKTVLKLSRDNNPSGRTTRPTRNTAIQTAGAMQPPINAPSMAVPARLVAVAWTGSPTYPHLGLEQINRKTNYRGYKSQGFWLCQMASFPGSHIHLAERAQLIVSPPLATDNEPGGWGHALLMLSQHPPRTPIYNPAGPPAANCPGPRSRRPFLPGLR